MEVHLMKFKFFFILLILIGIIAAQNSSDGTISGFVYSAADGERLIGANVYLEKVLLGSSTNLSGYYVIPQIPTGRYILICDYLGYGTFRREVTINEGEDIKLNITLAEEIMETEVISVVADSERVAERLYKKPISTVQLSPLQINKVPQVAEADLLRTLQTIPGIVPLSDFSSALYIRGGTPDQNLHLLDGTDVYNPEHMFGLFSTFNSDAIKHVELSKGGFGAEYGGRLSSVLDITNLDGNREEFEGMASLSLLSMKTTLQMPLGNIGSLSGSLRRTYFDKTVAGFIDDIPEYYFYDGSLKAFFDIDKNNKLTISGYGGSDFLDFTLNSKASEQEGFQYNWGNQTGSVRWTHVFSPRLFSNFWITYSTFNSDFGFDLYSVGEKNTIDDFTLKGNLEYHYSEAFSARFGFEQKNLSLDYYFSDPSMITDILHQATQAAFYGQVNWKPAAQWNFELGTRYTYFKSDTANHNWAPRFSVKYRVSEEGTLKLAAGRYYQYLHRISRFFISDIWTVSGKYQDKAHAHHYLIGYQQEIATDYELEIEAFYKDYQNIYSFNNNVGAEIQASTYTDNGIPVFNTTKDVFKRGDGQSYGIEILLRKDVGRISGWLGYSYAHTDYTIDDINKNRWFAPRHDRTSTINAMGNFDLLPSKNKLVLGVNFIYSTGQPITEPGSAYLISSGPFDPGKNINFAPTKINNIRLPDYIRLDLSLTYQINFSTWSIAPYLQVYNITNRGNVWFINYEYENGKPEISEQYMLPILPTLGANIRF
jgi:hypothetical protein